jgi:hypothetical protein
MGTCDAVVSVSKFYHKTGTLTILIRSSGMICCSMSTTQPIKCTNQMYRDAMAMAEGGCLDGWESSRDVFFSLFLMVFYSAENG